MNNTNNTNNTTTTYGHSLYGDCVYSAGYQQLTYYYSFAAPEAFWSLRSTALPGGDSENFCLGLTLVVQGCWHELLERALFCT
jgi:hypothetical protein